MDYGGRFSTRRWHSLRIPEKTMAIWSLIGEGAVFETLLAWVPCLRAPVEAGRLRNVRVEARRRFCPSVSLLPLHLSGCQRKKVAEHQRAERERAAAAREAERLRNELTEAKQRRADLQRVVSGGATCPCDSRHGHGSRSFMCCSRPGDDGRK